MTFTSASLQTQSRSGLGTLRSSQRKRPHQRRGIFRLLLVSGPLDAEPPTTADTRHQPDHQAQQPKIRSQPWLMEFGVFALATIEQAAREIEGTVLQDVEEFRAFKDVD